MEYLFLFYGTGYRSSIMGVKTCQWREATVSLIVFIFIDRRSLIISNDMMLLFHLK